MNHEARELEQLSTEAWGMLGADLRRTQKHVGELAKSCFREHPTLILVGGAAIAALAVSRAARPSTTIVHEKKQPQSRGFAVRTVLRMAQTWAIEALASGLAPSEVSTSGADESISPN